MGTTPRGAGIRGSRSRNQKAPPVASQSRWRDDPGRRRAQTASVASSAAAEAAGRPGQPGQQPVKASPETCAVKGRRPRRSCRACQGRGSCKAGGRGIHDPHDRNAPDGRRCQRTVKSCVRLTDVAGDISDGRGHLALRWGAPARPKPRRLAHSPRSRWCWQPPASTQPLAYQAALRTARACDRRAVGARRWAVRQSPGCSSGKVSRTAVLGGATGHRRRGSFGHSRRARPAVREVSPGPGTKRGWRELLGTVVTPAPRGLLRGEPRV
jgi:hypothetical protein